MKRLFKNIARIAATATFLVSMLGVGMARVNDCYPLQKYLDLLKSKYGEDVAFGMRMGVPQSEVYLSINEGAGSWTLFRVIRLKNVAVACPFADGEKFKPATLPGYGSEPL